MPGVQEPGLKMTESDGWLARYGRSHENLRYPYLYWVAVPMVVVGTVGLLWTVPVPEEFSDISPLLNWGSAFLMASAVYYFVISVPLAIGLLPFVVGVASLQVWLGDSDFSPLRVSAGLLSAGIIGLWLGHRDRGGIRSVVEDLQLMMIGPAWLLAALYRRVGIPI